ncbi:ABC transporter ATP-binding protein [Quadrisphaera oryzae]|uniref:ABC transporter ATP-binding protein n=1 Tax=Quadrisphaera TaxID=317661 RepID=UPI00164478B7|nr:ABC transporter ATP-binding protein [Quadrisphaera sp. RL12-1S]MBC3760752.1 ABC transporter ATP-binding protein [Quadrisphaera sp. RL12-1S]
MVAWVVVAAVLQGLAFLALAPLLAALLRGGPGGAAGPWGASAWLAVVVGLAAGYAVAFWCSSRAGSAVAEEVLTALLTRIGDRVVELPAGWFTTDRSGTVADLTTRGAVFAASAPYGVVRPLLTAVVTPTTVLLGALVIDWRLGLVVLCTVPVLWIVYRRLVGRLGAADAEHVSAVAESSARLVELARTQSALRAAGDSTIAQQLVDDALQAQRSANRHVHLTGGAGIGLFGATVQLAVVGMLLLGTQLALSGELAVEELVPLLVLAVRFTEPLVHSGALGGGVRVAANTLAQVRALLEEPTLPEPDRPATPDGYTLRLDGVTFAYGDAEPVLRDVTLEAPAGAMTAIVGPSGSGKTTITRLMARTHDPQAGVVSLGGVPLPQLGTVQVLAAVAPVFQDVYLFDGTVLDNVWLGDPDAPRERVLDAARRARVDEVAERLPQGWDSRVGEGGALLSGGERQRVSIARALLKDAPVVLLDEASAALDVTNEQAVQDAVAELRRCRTVVVVAHRLSTIATADRIVVLDGRGGVAEQGTHAELLAAGGTYARYWAERTRAAGWRLTTSATTSPPTS